MLKNRSVQVLFIPVILTIGLTACGRHDTAVEKGQLPLGQKVSGVRFSYNPDEKLAKVSISMIEAAEKGSTYTKIIELKGYVNSKGLSEMSEGRMSLSLSCEGPEEACEAGKMELRDGDGIGAQKSTVIQFSQNVNAKLSSKDLQRSDARAAALDMDAGLKRVSEIVRSPRTRATVEVYKLSNAPREIVNIDIEQRISRNKSDHVYISGFTVSNRSHVRVTVDSDNLTGLPDDKGWGYVSMKYWGRIIKNDSPGATGVQVSLFEQVGAGRPDSSDKAALATGLEILAN